MSVMANGLHTACTFLASPAPTRDLRQAPGAISTAMPSGHTPPCRAAQVRGSYGLSHAEAAERAAQVEPGCGGVTFLPLLGGERTPNWPHASGAIVGA